MGILLHRISTGNDRRVIPKESLGISKSSVSRQFIDQSPQELEVELSIIDLDGLIVGEHHVLCAVGVDAKGNRHVLGMVEGASETALSATAVLEDLVERGVDPRHRYRFVIDGSKALPATISRGFGAGSAGPTLPPP